MAQHIIDLGGNTVITENVRVGATGPGQAGTDISSAELTVLDGASAANTGTGKAVITGTSGATTIGGNLTVPTMIGGVQLISGPGAINLTTLITIITTTGSDAFTLADGTNGQVKMIVHGTDGGAAAITPTTLANGDVLTMSEAGDSVMLVFATTSGWHVVANNGTVVS